MACSPWFLALPGEEMGHGYGQGFFCSCAVARIRANTSPDPTTLGLDSGEELTKWENLNSFIAQFIKYDPVIPLFLPVCPLRQALEEPPWGESKRAEGGRLWVASMWMIECAGPIYLEMISERKQDAPFALEHRTGQLYDAKPLGVERWQFWKKRFSELITDADATAASHISDALRSMEAADKGTVYMYTPEPERHIGVPCVMHDGMYLGA